MLLRLRTVNLPVPWPFIISDLVRGGLLSVSWSHFIEDLSRRLHDDLPLRSMQSSFVLLQRLVFFNLHFTHYHRFATIDLLNDTVHQW